MKIKQDFIPTSNRNRPGAIINPTHITIHETANRSKGADAATHARYVKGAHAQNRSVSWHYTVDDKQIIQHLPNNEMGWHAGPNGNKQSIGIELCVNSDGDFEKTKANAQWLIRKLMNEFNISLERVVTHKHWAGKNCPATLLSSFENFKQGVVMVSASNVNANVPSDWAKPSWEKAIKNGVMNEGQGPRVPLTREQLAVILDRMGMLN